MVLRYLLEKKAERLPDGTRSVSVPEQPRSLIADALDRHVTDTLERVVREVEVDQPAKVRERTLLALHRLVGPENRRGPGIPGTELAAAIGSQGATVLERLADDRARIGVVQDGVEELPTISSPRPWRAWSRRRARTRPAPRRSRSQHRLFASKAPEARTQATRMSVRQLVRIRRAKDALLSAPAQRDWFRACWKRWTRRAAIAGAGALVLAAVVGLGEGVLRRSQPGG